MKVPVEFTKFADKFYQGSESGHSIEEWLDPKINELSKETKIEICGYLKTLLEDPNGELEMRAAWLSGAAAYGVDRGEWRAFFTVLLDRFEVLK